MVSSFFFFRGIKITFCHVSAFCITFLAFIKWCCHLSAILSKIWFQEVCRNLLLFLTLSLFYRRSFSILCPVPLEQPEAVCPLSHFSCNMYPTALELNFPISNLATRSPLMSWNCFIDIGIENFFVMTPLSQALLLDTFDSLIVWSSIQDVWHIGQCPYLKKLQTAVLVCQHTM